MKEIIEKRFNLKLKKITTKYPEVGKTYFCGYWNKTFECIEIKESEIWGKEYVCKWNDGHITTHCTKFGKYDFEVIEGA